MYLVRPDVVGASTIHPTLKEQSQTEIRLKIHFIPQHANITFSQIFVIQETKDGSSITLNLQDCVNENWMCIYFEFWSQFGDQNFLVNWQEISIEKFIIISQVIKNYNNNVW